jgi:DNA-binding SARP family transcriptional activator
LLGAPRIEIDGTPIKVDTRKAIALLAYLAMTGEAHTRDALATLLWPEYDQTHARAALRRTLSTLKTAGGDEWLEIDRESIGLLRDRRAGADQPSRPYWLDVDQFHQKLAECQTHGHPESEVCLACLDPLSQAVALFRDDFLAGFTLRDSPSFDEWQFFQSERLRRELAWALERLVQAHAQSGQVASAIPHAQRWLALDPLHEPAHRLLMQLYVRTGQRGAALRQYRECVRVLAEELGVAPLEQTTELYQSIKEHPQPPAPQPPVPGPQPQSLPHPITRRGFNQLPLVGRTAEWLRLERTYNAIETAGHFVILEGEAGIGKTRLAEEFLAHVQARGATTLPIRCYEGEANLAYGPFVEGLRAAVSRADCTPWVAAAPAPWLSEVARLLPELAGLRPDLPPAPPLDSPGAQSRFFEAISQVLPSICSLRSESYPLPHPLIPAPGVLFVDDLHWADTASLDLLTYLVRRLPRRPLLILVTWRDEQAPAAQRVHNLLTEARRAASATILRLTRLNLPDVMELVQSSTPASTVVPAQAVQLLYRETEGLPFFLAEYLAMLAEGADLVRADNWPMPGSVRGLLHARLSSADETARQLLTTAAVIGRSFDFDTLREASGRSDEETVVGLEELVAQGLIQEAKTASPSAPPSAASTPSSAYPFPSAASAASAYPSPEPAGQKPSYDFSHEKLRTLVYDDTSLARRRLLHRRVAEALVKRARDWRESRGQVQMHAYAAGQIAHHFQLAGQEGEAAEYFKQAGDYARQLYATRAALAHFQSALALGYPDAPSLYEAMGDLQTLLGEYGAALKSYELAAAACPSQSLPTLEHKLGNVHHRRGEWELAKSHFQAALTALETSGPGDASGERARLYADWSLAAHHAGQTSRALDLARQALELGEATKDSQALAQAHNILGILARSQGDYDRARYHLEHSLMLAEALGDAGARAAALNNLALVLTECGEIDQALNLTQSALDLCASQGDRHREAALHNNLADLLHAAGRSEEAMTHLKQAVAIFAEVGEETGRWQPEIWKLTEW